MAAFKSFDDMKVGMRVRCIYDTGNKHKAYGQIGTITNLEFKTIGIVRIHINWDNPGYDSWKQWGCFDSFELLEDIKVSNGATCSKCNYYNEYATSSSYVCQQCKLWDHIAG